MARDHIFNLFLERVGKKKIVVRKEINNGGEATWETRIVKEYVK